jgi:hypothetical protein
MNKPKGGRGHRVPYASRTIRVPDPIRDRVEQVIQDFYGEPTENAGLTQTLPEALETAEAILKSKKGARESLRRLLAVLYGTDVTL